METELVSYIIYLTFFRKGVMQQKIKLYLLIMEYFVHRELPILAILLISNKEIRTKTAKIVKSLLPW